MLDFLSLRAPEPRQCCHPGGNKTGDETCRPATMLAMPLSPSFCSLRPGRQSCHGRIDAPRKPAGARPATFIAGNQVHAAVRGAIGRCRHDVRRSFLFIFLRFHVKHKMSPPTEAPWPTSAELALRAVSRQTLPPIHRRAVQMGEIIRPWYELFTAGRGW